LGRPDAGRLRNEAAALLRRLLLCDTSNPPGREAQVVAVLEDFLGAAGVHCERVAKDPERPNLLATVPGRGDGSTLAFLGHADVVPVRREDWTVDPFAAIVADGAIWGRGAVDMKCQVAAVAVALAELAREGGATGDRMLVVTADEEVGDADVGATFLVAERPDLRIDFVVGEGAGERYPTPAGPIYLLDCGVKSTTSATVRVRGVAGDASLPAAGESALREVKELLAHLDDHRPRLRVPAELRPLLDLVGGSGTDEERLGRVREAHPPLAHTLEGLTRTVIRPTVLTVDGPQNMVPEAGCLVLQCIAPPGVARAEIEEEVRAALGPGDYELELDDPLGGSTSPPGTPLQDAIEAFLAEHDPESTLVPALGYGFSDCHFLREAYGAVAYGFIPFRHADPLVNLMTKHGADERVLAADVEFQALAALSIARYPLA
jgi:acetylornithine deacetylase/succinyl-diaminopimelate desuccinylase-like protein